VCQGREPVLRAGRGEEQCQESSIDDGGSEGTFAW